MTITNFILEFMQRLGLSYTALFIIPLFAWVCYLISLIIRRN